MGAGQPIAIFVYNLQKAAKFYWFDGCGGYLFHPGAKSIDNCR
jgi:hypothetical protein